MTHLTHTTRSAKPKLNKRAWHLIDASEKVLGRLASDVATRLIGKHKTNYALEADLGDFVVVVNSKNIKVTGNKAENKIYTNYSGYPGGLRKVSMSTLLVNKPNLVIKKAVYGMLPKNKLRKDRIKRLFIYESSTHPHQKEFA